jgi:hypothetical protein
MIIRNENHKFFEVINKKNFMKEEFREEKYVV